MTSPVLVEIDDSGTPALRDPGAGLVRVDEPGYLRGDGVFETLAVIGGRAHGQQEHLARLAASAAAVGLEIPPSEAWSAAIALAVQKNLSMMGHCLGLTEDLARAIDDYAAGLLRVHVDSVFDDDHAAEFIERSFNSPERFGKAVLAYGA